MDLYKEYREGGGEANNNDNNNNNNKNNNNCTSKNLGRQTRRAANNAKEM